MSHRKYKAVLLDAGGTLLQPHRPVGEIYCETARRYGGEFDPGLMEKAFREVFKSTPEIPVERAASATDYFEWWRELVYACLDRLDAKSQAAFYERRSAYFQELYDVFAHPDVWEIMPDALEVIGRLKSNGYRLALVSNWDLRLRPLMDRLDLTPHFEVMVISSEVGVEKPHPAIFHKTLEHLRLAPEEVCHVGDSPAHDEIGAREAGIDYIHVKYPELTLTRALESLFR